MAEVQTGIALHQFRRDPLFRSVIVPDTECWMVEFDASGQEFRLMAEVSGDETMMALCEPGQDAHSYMGAVIGSQDYHALMRSVHEGNKDAKHLRQLGKVGNLACQYRISAQSLQIRAKSDHNLALEFPVVEHIWRMYRRTYTEVPVYWTKQSRLAREQGYIQNLAGRRINVQDLDSYQQEQTAINFPVQSLGADMKYLALNVVRAQLVRYPGSRFLFDLHDGLYFSVPKAKAEKFAIETRALFGKLPYKKAWGYQPRVPLPWDAKLGPSWGQLKELP